MRRLLYMVDVAKAGERVALKMDMPFAVRRIGFSFRNSPMFSNDRRDI
jgi:hypothetical protein